MDEQEEDFTLTLKGKGINVEKIVDQKTALAVLSIVWGDAPDMERNVPPEDQAPGGQRHSVSMGEYIDQTGASTNKERIVAIGMYLSEYKNTLTFSRSDIVAGFRSAREQMPKNMTRDLSSTAEARWIEETEENGIYYVTNTGVRAVQGKFGGIDAASATPKTSPKKTRRRKHTKGANSPENGEGKKPKAPVGELRSTVGSWIASGFFDEPRTISDLQNRFHERAIIVKQTSLSPLLMRLVRDEKLARKKQEVGGKQLWTYLKA